MPDPPDVTGDVAVVASSPTQVLHALELIHASGEHSSLTVLRPPEPAAAAQIGTLVAHAPSVPVQHVDLGGPFSVPRKLAWLRRASREYRGKRLAIGEYRLELLRELASRAEPAELILLDDGNATLLVNDVRRGLLDVAQARVGRPGRNWRHRLHPLVGIRDVEPPQVTFFTIYDLEPRPGDKVRLHGYEWLKRRWPQAEPDGSTVFLGSSAVESGIIGEPTYLQMIGQAMDSDGPPERYLPHRREGAEKLARIASRFCITVEHPSTPVEHHFRVQGRFPTTAWCLPSTVADSLSIALDGRINLRVLAPHPEVTNPDARAVLARLVSHANARSAVASLTIEPAPAGLARTGMDSV